MRTEHVLGGSPAGTPRHCTVRVCHRGERIETDRGTLYVAKLRPGDRAWSPEIGAEVSVLWMAMSRVGPEGRIIFRVMLGREAARDSGPGVLPVGARVSKRTGRLEPCGRGECTH